MDIQETRLEPETIPGQLSETFSSGARIQPEKRLQVGVLADAVLTFHRWAGAERPRAQRLFAEVETWFASDDADGPFTFITICDSLGFDPNYLRHGLRHWRASVEAPARRKRSVRHDGDAVRPQVALPGLRRVA